MFSLKLSNKIENVALYLLCILLSKSRFEIFAWNKIEYSGLIHGGKKRKMTKYIVMGCRIS